MSTKNVYTSRHVVFYEHIFPYSHNTSMSVSCQLMVVDYFLNPFLSHSTSSSSPFVSSPPPPISDISQTP